MHKRAERERLRVDFLQWHIFCHNVAILSSESTSTRHLPNQKIQGQLNEALFYQDTFVPTSLRIPTSQQTPTEFVIAAASLAVAHYRCFSGRHLCFGASYLQRGPLYACNYKDWDRDVDSSSA
ncbi:hypothetical protein V2J09_021975 [Rumex salicifolius]